MLVLYDDNNDDDVDVDDDDDDCIVKNKKHINTYQHNIYLSILHNLERDNHDR
jgi:hypothetical protein